MKVGDLVMLKKSIHLSLDVVVELGGEHTGYEGWLAIQFMGEKGPGWWMRRSLKLWSDNESR